MDFTVIIAIGIAAFLFSVIGAICKIIKDAKGEKQPKQSWAEKATPVEHETVKTEEKPKEKEPLTRKEEPEIVTEENLRWPLFDKQELGTMGWGFIFHENTWDEIHALLRQGKYEEAEQEAKKFQKEFPTSMMPDLLLLEAQHRKGDFSACSETFRNTKRSDLAFFSELNRTPLVLEYSEAMLDLQNTIPGLIQTAWMGAHECLDKVMRPNPPERSYVICIRAFEAALALGKPLFGGNEEALIKDYIKSGLSWHPESKTLLELKSKYA
jgi:hypothetical protein